MTLALTPLHFGLVLAFDLAVAAVVGGALGLVVRRFGFLRRWWVELGLGAATFFVVSNTLAVIGMVAFGALSEFPKFDPSQPPVVAASALGMAAGSAALVGMAALAGSLSVGGRPTLGWLAGGLGLSVGMVALSAGWGVFLASVGVEPEPQWVVEALLGGEPWVRVALVGFIAGWAPVVEELVFRSWLQGRLASRWSPAVAIGVQACAFSVLHMDRLWALPPILLIGATAGWLRHRSGSLAPSIAFHFGNNSLALVSAFLA